VGTSSVGVALVQNRTPSTQGSEELTPLTTQSSQLENGKIIEL